MAGVKDLRVWQEAVGLGGDIVRAIAQSSRRETKAFTEQILLAAAVPAVCIAEAHALSSVAEQRACYLRAKRSLVELETHLTVARQAELLTPTAFAQLGARLNGVAQLLAGYLSIIDRQERRSTVA
jgi:four helix bundle protein